MNMGTEQKMQNWLTLLNDKLLPAVQHNAFWCDVLTQFDVQEACRHSVHLAIFVEPYLQYVLDGSKTIESRFSTRRFAPYNQVGQGDIILLKKSSGPVVGICQVMTAWFYQLENKSWGEIKQNYSADLCAQDPKFWQDRKGASFATLIRIGHVLPVEPFAVDKRDRRGWVVLHAPSQQMEFQLEAV